MPPGLVLSGLLIMLIVGGAVRVSAETSQALEILALHTVGIPRVGLCNQVRVTVAGTGEVELRVEQAGETVYRSTARAEEGTGAVWFRAVDFPAAAPLQLVARSATLSASADVSAEVSTEAQPATQPVTLGRHPLVRCGENALPRAGQLHKLSVTVLVPETGEPLAGVTVHVGADQKTTDSLGTAVFSSVRADPRSRPPGVEVRAERTGCRPASLQQFLAVKEHAVRVPLVCDEVERAELVALVPVEVRVDSEVVARMSYGDSLVLSEVLAGDLPKTIQLMSPRGTDLGALAVEPRRQEVLPDRYFREGTGVADSWTGLFWGVPAGLRLNARDSVAACEQLAPVRGASWRLPTIDELEAIFPRPELDRGAEPSPLSRVPGCCTWSSTVQGTEFALSYYVREGHIYPRRFEAETFDFLCVSGEAFEVDPLRVPVALRPVVVPQRRFRPPETNR